MLLVYYFHCLIGHGHGRMEEIQLGNLICVTCVVLVSLCIGFLDRSD